MKYLDVGEVNEVNKVLHRFSLGDLTIRGRCELYSCA